MGVLNKTLEKLDGYLLSIQRNTETAKYELEVGIPKNWVYQGNGVVDFEIIKEVDVGSIVRIFGLTEDIVIDDLIDFVNKIIDTNKKIAEREIEFNERLAEAKKLLETEVENFQHEIENLKENAFTTLIKEEKSITKQKVIPKKKTGEKNEEISNKVSS